MSQYFKLDTKFNEIKLEIAVFNLIFSTGQFAEAYPGLKNAIFYPIANALWISEEVLFSDKRKGICERVFSGNFVREDKSCNVGSSQ